MSDEEFDRIRTPEEERLRRNPGESVTADELATQLVYQYRDLVLKMQAADKTGGLTETIEYTDPSTGEVKFQKVPTQLGYYKDSADVLADQLEQMGLDVNGLPLDDPSKISANVSAQLASAAADRELRERLGFAEIASAERNADLRATVDREEFGVRKEISGLTLAQQQREAERRSRDLELGRISEEKMARESLAQRYTDTYVSAVSDLLDAEIARGNLSVNEAEQRRMAATSAAQIQADLLTDLGGYQLAPGAEYFPGLGPADPASAIAKAMGFAPPTMPTSGTFKVSPGAMVDPIYGALAGMNGGAIADTAIGNAIQQFGALGVPLNGSPSRQTGVGMDPLAAALAAGG